MRRLMIIAAFALACCVQNANAQTITGTELHITTSTGAKLDVDGSGLRYQTATSIFFLAPDPATGKQVLWFQSDIGIFRMHGNELFVGSLIADPPKVRIAGCDASGGALSFDWWPGGSDPVSLFYVYEITRFQGKMLESNPATFGGQFQLWNRKTNDNSSDPSAIVQQWMPPGNGSGAPAYTPCGSTPPPPPPCSSCEQTSGTAYANVAANNFTYIDRSWSVDPGRAITAVGIYSDVAASIPFKIVRQTASGQPVDVVYETTISHPGGGWVEVPASYTAPNDGATYYAAAYSANLTMTLFGGLSRAYAPGDIHGTGVTVTEQNAPGPFPENWLVIGVRIRYAQ